MRLQKFIAHAGVCSRRHAEELIEQGKVQVNNKTITKLGTVIDPEHDTVQVNDKTISIEENGYVYIILNKPVDYVCSNTSSQGKSVLELITEANHVNRKQQKPNERVYPVGRLDKDSEGLVLLTNDGELTNQLTHPKNKHEKEYILTIDKPLTREITKLLQKGMKLSDTEVKGMRILKSRRVGKYYEVSVVITEGKNRQLRKMLGRLGYNVWRLKRVRIEKLKLGTLPVGRWRYVKKNLIV